MNESSSLPKLPGPVVLKRVILLLILVPALTFAWSLRNDFVEWDDPGLITENPIVQSMSFANLKAAFTRYDPELYIPLTFVSYQMDSLIAGLNPFVFHLHNLALHIVNVLLAAWLVYLLTGDGAAAVFCGLLFAVHPLQVEAVVWASARKDLLSTAWFLTSMLAFLYARARKSRGLLIFSLVAFTCALLAKVMVITLPILLLLIAWRKDGKLQPKAITGLWPYFGLSVLFGIVALLGKQAFVAAASPVDMVLIAGTVTIFLLSKFFLPVGLSVLYPYTDPVTIASPELAGSVVGVIALTVLATVAARKWNRDILFGWLWFLICLSPTYFLYRKGEHLGDIYVTSDRYFYAAGIGIIFLAGLLFSYCWKKQRTRTAAGIVAAAVIAGCAAGSVFLSREWRNNDTLFLRVLRLYPNSHVAHLTVGNYWQRLGNLDKAFAEYDAALRIRPTSLTLYNLGNAFLAIGKTDEAIQANAQALQLDPAFAEAAVNLGVGYVRKQMFNEAAAAFTKAIELNPQSVEAHFNLGVMFEKKKDWEGAAREYETVLRLDPTLEAAALKLAAVRVKMNENLP